MSEHEYTPTEKIRMAEEFRDTPFYRLVFEPHIHRRFQESMAAFVDCKKKDLKKLQVAVRIYDDLDNFVDEYMEAAQTQIEMDKAAEGIEQARQPDEELETMIDEQD